jgi:hypothetical protein
MNTFLKWRNFFYISSVFSLVLLFLKTNDWHNISMTRWFWKEKLVSYEITHWRFRPNTQYFLKNSRVLPTTSKFDLAEKPFNPDWINTNRGLLIGIQFFQLRKGWCKAKVLQYDQALNKMVKAPMKSMEFQFFWRKALLDYALKAYQTAN